MQESLLPILRCPITRSRLTLNTIKVTEKKLDGGFKDSIDEGILFSDNGWFYPVIKGIPILIADAIIEYEDFLKKYLPDFAERKIKLFDEYEALIEKLRKKNHHTRRTFSKEWSIFDPEKDKTWDARTDELVDRFLKETDETAASLQHKIVFDAGCGNGVLNTELGKAGIMNVGMDFSTSIEAAYDRNEFGNVHFIRGDVQYPPVAFNFFDVVHSSGVLIATNNTELSFSCIEPAVKPGGKLSVWLYQPRKDKIHNLFNGTRRFTTKLPLGLQYFFSLYLVFPVSYIIKRIKGNKQNTREMKVDILDWFTPEFRWEHDQKEAASWFYKRDYKNVKVTTDNMFGFNITGVKPE